MKKVAIRRKRKSGWWIVPLLAVAFVYTAFTVYSQSREMYAIRIEMKEVQKRIDREKALKQELLKQKDQMNSDESIEKIAREKLGMVKDGERIFVDINQ
ncbi:MAG TPA: septum formation initiator family protein [Thermoclostridium sp.]|nr:septum formation initiator family protein [Thermoclostridium sp.]HPU44667.1 septum formation initiator family protein [Thermoclostridium sp.]